MGATYTRQSSFTDGDVITADLFNNEYDQLLAAFAASTGHTHDGTTAEGGPITKLLGTSLTFGNGTTGTDITVTFDGESNDGVLKWMEDEDYFEFSDDLLIASTEKIQFRDTGIYLNSSADGQLDIVADSEIQIAATTIDINGNVDISGTLTIGGAGISEAELEILDGATVTTTEINILDGDTTASSTTVVDADRVVFNDAGTMKQVAVTDLAAYFDDEITAMPNLVTTAATTVGALDSGSITSGFGTIDTGSSTITTTGLISGGSLDIDNVLINGTTIGHTDDTDLITLANGVVTVAGEVSMTTLDIGGTNVTSTATELNLLDGVSGLVQADFTKLAAVDSTAAELNIVDGGTSATATTVADADRVVMNDNGTMVQVAVTDLAAYFDDEITAMPNLVTTAATTVGALNSGSITSGFGTINNGSSTITTTGLISGGSLDIDDVLINGATIGHTSDTDLITLADGVVTVAGEVSMTTLDIGGTNVTSTAAELNILDGVTSTAAELNILDGVTSTAAELNILDGVTSTAAELNILDGVTSTATELNILDGKTFLDEDNLASDSATGIASQQSIKAYVDSAVGSSIVATGALNSGSITSGFGNIDTGSSTITTTGAITSGNAVIKGLARVSGTTSDSAFGQVSLGNTGASTGSHIIGTADAQIKFLSGAPLGANATEHMRINASGNVGIGDTSPSTALEVNGTVTATAFAGSGVALTGVGSTFISSSNLSDAATASFTGFNASLYDAYEFVLMNVIPATDTVALQMRTSGNGGSSYDSGASDYKYEFSQGASTRENDNSEAFIKLTKTNVGSASGEHGVNGIIRVLGPHLEKHTFISGLLSAETDGGSMNAVTSSGKRTQATPVVNAVQFFFSSGNIETGTITMYGIRNS